ncbi:MAG: hypothetical protein DRN15_06020 [Thermoprotei archaeon]|nr:MAG: hypothetical protein DRN15_06020 [Thermoprotei archaeon]RLF25012.1 MAG: hypothetical protein DRM97_02605 [Thermoprotei archaeon]
MQERPDPYQYIELYRQGVLPGKVRRRRVRKLSIEDIMNPVRPFFSKICPGDTVYVRTFQSASLLRR